MKSIAVMRMLRKPAEQAFPFEFKNHIGDDVVEMRIDYPSTLMEDIILANQRYAADGMLFVSSSWLKHEYSPEEWSAAKILGLKSKKTYRYCLEQLGAKLSGANPELGIFGDEGPSIELERKIVYRGQSFATFTGEEVWANSFTSQLSTIDSNNFDVVNLKVMGETIPYCYMNAAYKCHLSKDVKFADSLLYPDSNIGCGWLLCNGKCAVGTIKNCNRINSTRGRSIYQPGKTQWA